MVYSDNGGYDAQDSERWVMLRIKQALPWSLAVESELQAGRRFGPDLAAPPVGTHAPLLCTRALGLDHGAPTSLPAASE